MVDIIIPYTADRLNGLELHFALRSIRKYLTGYGKIYVIGDKPKEEGVIHIPAADVPGRKEKSICDKMLTACNLPEISESILIWHDDHILLKPLEVSGIKPWHNGPLTKELKRTHSGYKQTVINTLNHFQWQGEPLNFDIHTPFIINKEKFKQINTAEVWKREMCVKSLYFNTLKATGEYMEDLKINQSGINEQRVMEAIKGRYFLSTGPAAMEPPLIGILEKLFLQV